MGEGQWDWKVRLHDLIWFVYEKLTMNCFQQNVYGVRENILQVGIVTQLHYPGCNTSDVCWIEEGFRLLLSQIFMLELLLMVQVHALSN